MKKILNIKTEDLFLLMFVIIIHLTTYLKILPDTQNLVNSHTENTNGIAYFVIAALLSMFALYILLFKKNIKLFSLILISSGSFAFWGFILNSLSCMACANSG